MNKLKLTKTIHVIINIALLIMIGIEGVKAIQFYNSIIMHQLYFLTVVGLSIIYFMFNLPKNIK